MIYDIGDRVVHYGHNKTHAGWSGVVVATETFKDSRGTERYVYVRWIDPHGKVAGDLDRLAAWEVVRLDQP